VTLCSDWASASESNRGAVGSAEGPDWLGSGVNVRCDQELRILCAGFK